MRERDKGIDAIKGFGILCVVWAHTVTFGYIKPDGFQEWVRMVFLNGFFISAGWIYEANSNCKSCCSEVKRKVISLGIPYILLSASAFVYQIVIGGVLGNPYISELYSGKKLILRDVYCIVSLLGIGTLWFLPILLISMISVIIISKKIKNTKIRIFVMATICIAIGILFKMWLGNLEIENTSMINKILSEELLFVKRILMGIAYVWLGYIVKKIYNKIQVNTIVNLLIGIVLLGIGYLLYSLKIDMCEVVYVLSFLLIMINICKYKPVEKILTPIIYCGENSLYIMVIHYIFVYPVVMSMLGGNYDFVYMSPYKQGIIEFVIVLILTILLTILCKRSNKVKFAFGQGNRFREYRNRLCRRWGR